MRPDRWMVSMRRFDGTVRHQPRSTYAQLVKTATKCVRRPAIAKVEVYGLRTHELGDEKELLGTARRVMEGSKVVVEFEGLFFYRAHPGRLLSNRSSRATAM